MYVRAHREGCILQYAKYFFAIQWKVVQNQDYQEASFRKHLLWKSRGIHLGSGSVYLFQKAFFMPRSTRPDLINRLAIKRISRGNIHLRACILLRQTVFLNFLLLCQGHNPHTPPIKTPHETFNLCYQESTLCSQQF